jgi:hypothetical protein
MRKSQWSGVHMSGQLPVSLASLANLARPINARRVQSRSSSPSKVASPPKCRIYHCMLACLPIAFSCASSALIARCGGGSPRGPFLPHLPRANPKINPRLITPTEQLPQSRPAYAMITRKGDKTAIPLMAPLSGLGYVANASSRNRSCPSSCCPHAPSSNR